MSDAIPRLLLAAPASGSGKTTLALGLLHVLKNRGLSPAAFKCGPDYIDSMFHREVLGIPGRNLDLFLSSPAIARGLLRSGASGCGIAVIEGVMGYYDGVGGSSDASSWQVAAETETPAVLVVRPKGAFLSLAAVISGFERFRQNSMVRGVVFNRCAESLYSRLAPVVEKETGIKVYGFVPESREMVLESRHLGLVPPEEMGELRHKIAVLATVVEKNVDIDGLTALAGSAPPMTNRLPATRRAEGTPVGVAVAMDGAFCFYYEENLDLLRRFGAELLPFSPLRDHVLPPGAAALYLGGGYPELHAGTLAGNHALLADVRRAIASGMPTLAEGGGFLYLQNSLEDAAGVRHRMAEVLDGDGFNAGRLRHFGYARLTAKTDSFLCDCGETIAAHEFHHWDSANPGGDFLARKDADPEGRPCVHARGNVFAGFPHLYFWGHPALAERFVAAAVRHRDAKA